ncbi:uncharacterized protein LOC120270929 [Dioscorea cayenensis subsp. rotundata]|uniref:Uncharacterized protein LOC120270929 n=1 Tax=Dioscorea cayennensis subsp. rotundata TaxID=55577 RepID=A0AB40C2E1_DIOCR|nr:uncharacterized protein LOC120270929 [Dioscorea cayenensis subsp. rotundata]
MTITKRPLNSNMPRPLSRTAGWTAFDHKQRNKGVAGITSDLEPFPSLSNNAPSVPVKNLPAGSSVGIKSFASVVQPSRGFPLLEGQSKGEKQYGSSGAVCQGLQLNPESSVHASVKWLKGIHGWANESLIEDVLTSVDYDVDKACLLLKSMVSPGPEEEEANLPAQNTSIMVKCDGKNRGSSENILSDNKLVDGANDLPAVKQPCFVLVEPEWEEDDVYFSHRKDALRMMRVASQHSRAASNAFLRGDHSSAHQLSLKARDEWIAAEKLNHKAAEEILQINNRNNDLWKLDLHGLHASEAVTAVKERLHQIESQIFTDSSASSEGLTKTLAGMPRSRSVESLSSTVKDSEDIRTKPLSFQRQSVLNIITGMGKHSGGQATLPSAVRSFLIENKYRFDEARPGLISVHPRFRRM